MEQNEKEYEKFVEWLNGKSNFSGFTLSEVEFAKQMFEFLEDYPSFKKKLSSNSSSKMDVFGKIHQFLREMNK